MAEKLSPHGRGERGFGYDKRGVGKGGGNVTDLAKIKTGT